MAGTKTATFDTSFLTQSLDAPKRTVNKTLERLDQSPFISGSASNLKEFIASGKKAEKKNENPLFDSTWSLKVHATEALSGKHQSSAGRVKQQQEKLATAKKSKNRFLKDEPQGPIDWSTRGLCSKYRGEIERENLWQSWAMANVFAEAASGDAGLILSVAKVERHPLYVLYNKRIELENTESFKRTRARLRMKRFVLDVQEIWLSNLQHLREHQPALLLQERPDSGNYANPKGGLAGRRDTESLSGMDSQIQSVSTKRALKASFRQPQLDEPGIVMDYKPGPAPSLVPPPPLPPVIEPLMEGLSISPFSVDEELHIRRLTENSSVGGRMFDRRPTGNTHLLFIDRMLPSAQSLQRDVAWRISIIQKFDIIIGYFYISETDVLAFLGKARVATSDAAISEVVHETVAQLPWSVMELVVKFSISLSISADNFKTICITIRATLGAEFNRLSLEVQSNVAELLSMYPAECSGPNVLNDYGWWKSSQANDVWKRLLESLVVKEDEYNDEGDPYPMTMILKRPRTVSSGIEEAVSTPQAFSAALDLSKFIVVSASARNGEPIGIAVSCPSCIIHGDRNHFSDQWEQVADNVPSLSLRVSGTLNKNALCPGSQDFGKPGLWFTYRHDRERTQIAANFFRDSEVSSTDSVMILMSLALDTPILVPTSLAWEDFSEEPAKMPGEVADGVVPVIVSRPNAILKEQLVSPLTDRLSFQAAIFSHLPTEGVDYINLSTPTFPDGMQRHWPFRNKYGFRRKVIEHLLGVDVILPTIVFGITRSGAVPNLTGVTTRNIWHSILAIVEHINRPRTAIDYMYVIRNSSSRGANDPAAYIVIMQGGEFFKLQCTAFSKFEEEYAEIRERRAIFARQAALDAKIEISEIALRTRSRLLEAQILKEKQRAVEKKLRKATKSERGWKRRYNMSVLVEIQGSWEKRKDYYSGAMFFHKIMSPIYPQGDLEDDDLSSLGSLKHDGVSKSSSPSQKKGKAKEKFLQTCQWQVPSTWDGDPLSEANAPSYAGNISNVVGDNQSVSSQSAISLSEDSHASRHHRAVEVGAFQEPKDNWMPGGDFSILDADVTPGINPSASLMRPTKENDRNDLMHTNHNNTSLVAEKSYNGKSSVATVDTGNMGKIAEQLVQSDELIRILAKRLGLPLTNLVSMNEMPSVFTTTSSSIQHHMDPKSMDLMHVKDGDALPAPRDTFEQDVEDPEFDEDDELWSDDDYEAGDYDEENVGDLPQNHGDVLKLKLSGIREQKIAKGKVSSVPSNIPYLNLKEKGIVNTDANDSNMMAWRRLPRPEIEKSFHAKLLQRRTIGADEATSNKPNNTIFLLPISPVDACEYVPVAFEAPIESIFIPNAKKDMERAIATLARNIKREEELAKNVPTDDLILFGKASENTSADIFLAKQYKQDQEAFIDPREAAIDKAVMAAKASNITEMEDALEEDIPIDSADPHGNSLLLLAAQQGSKRMCKFLLRRGANMNAQNLAGNTVLHFCFTYSHTELGKYLMDRGADDSILNVDGLTCYEGLGEDALEDPYD